MFEVHQSEDGSLSVLGLMCTEGDSGLSFWEELEQSLHMEAVIDLHNLFNSVDLTRYYTYAGSLTTPPCTEGVSWTVLTDYCYIPKSTLQKLLEYPSMQNNCNEN